MAKETTAYTDSTGQFPYQSSRGNNYRFFAYNYDGNAILVKPTAEQGSRYDNFVLEKISQSSY